MAIVGFILLLKLFVILSLVVPQSAQNKLSQCKGDNFTEHSLFIIFIIYRKVDIRVAGT